VSQRRLAAWRKLTTKKGRARAGEIIVAGVRLVADVVHSGQTVMVLLACDDPQGKEAVGALGKLVTDWYGDTFRVGARDFAQLTQTVHPAGVAAIMRWAPAAFDPKDVSDRDVRRVLYCDRITDPGNLGTLIRAAAGLGVDRVFTHPEAVELTNPKTVRAGSGALFRIPIYEGVPAADVVVWGRERGLAVLVADAHEGSELPADHRLRRWMLVVGGETKPFDPTWDDVPARRVRLPLRRGVESLNAGVAGAILIDRLSRLDR
jgi:TrmH family RNA methyltransferase